MVVTQIQNLEINELQELIEASVKNALERNASTREPETELITRKEVAKLLSISLVTLTEWVKQGKVPAFKIGSRVRFRKDEVLNSLKEIQTLKHGRA